MTHPNWSFTVLLEREPSGTELDAMFEAGLDDSTIESGPRACFMHMDRVAPTLLLNA